MISDQILFTATKSDPFYTVEFKERFNEVGSGDGFTLMSVSKIATSQTNEGDLIIFAYIRGQEAPAAKKFLFFKYDGDESKAILKQRMIDNKPTGYYSLEIQKSKER